ncbi:nucleotide sugar dehydrogenase [uncultured Shimia sp.]|uniref:nucleotide sugar dehydrogenase n=1 Tax=uncultured Shimia sp. TaxID=573152 RepID=UPI0026386EF7|nr:nucleotide sugar dehydrogenase [uncultured Shimia sp.]
MSLANKILERDSQVGVIGLGYVGLPLAVTAARSGFPVVGFDVDSNKVEQLARGKSYIDAVSDDALEEARANGMVATRDFAQLTNCQIIVICVPTPLNIQREPDLSYVEETARTISEHIQPDTLVVLESTTYPGTTEEILAPILATSGFDVGGEIYLGFSPEREDPGNIVYDTRSIPKIVAGINEDSSGLVEAFYSRIVDRTVRVSTTQTAEAVKITENIFRSVNIALVNELKLIFDAMDIDIWEVIEGAATKPFGFMPFYPGPGLGGHCIPIDPFYLTWKAREFEVPTRFIELAGEINTHMPYHIVNRLRQVVDENSGQGLRGTEVLLVGVAYKKNVSDMRESPAMKLMQLLEEAGVNVSFIDPHVPEIPPMREYGQFVARHAISPKAITKGRFAAVLIATDHNNIEYAPLLDLGCPVLDTRNVIAKLGLPLDNVTKI